MKTIENLHLAQGCPIQSSTWMRWRVAKSESPVELMVYPMISRASTCFNHLVGGFQDLATIHSMSEKSHKCQT